jgi:hypothetical protein
MSRIEPTVQALETRLLRGGVGAPRAGAENAGASVRAAVDEALVRGEAPR